MTSTPWCVREMRLPSSADASSRVIWRFLSSNRPEKPTLEVGRKRSINRSPMLVAPMTSIRITADLTPAICSRKPVEGGRSAKKIWKIRIPDEKFDNGHAGTLVTDYRRNEHPRPAPDLVSRSDFPTKTGTELAATVAICNRPSCRGMTSSANPSATMRPMASTVSAAGLMSSWRPNARRGASESDE